MQDTVRASQGESQKKLKPFSEKLQTVKIGKETLDELITSGKKPYLERVKAKLTDQKLGELIADVQADAQEILASNRLYYEYWHWIFRYARKALQSAKD